MSAVGPLRPTRPRPGPPWLAVPSAMGRLTRAADHSKLTLAAAAALAVFGGPDGRRAATGGLAAVGVTATLVNVGLKLVARRRHPDPVAAAVPITRQVKMPATRSFPSGHSAAVFAFATGVGCCPGAAIPLRALAYGSVPFHRRGMREPLVDSSRICRSRWRWCCRCGRSDATGRPLLHDAPPGVLTAGNQARTGRQLALR